MRVKREGSFGIKMVVKIQQLPICDCILFYIILSFFPDLLGDELYLFIELSDFPMIVRSLAC